MSLSLEEIRKRRMAEISQQDQAQQYAQGYGENAQAAQLEAELKQIMPKILGPEAMERLNMIKSTKPDFAMQMQIYLVSIYRQGGIRQPLDDVSFKQILDGFVRKPDWNIRRK
ncbi:MAG: hypothetical protein GQ477_02655 [Nanohaloarchaea archaeon]|nr:hypothetical protein [Candidatus Nanohaloarchaea archaeon]